MVNRLTTADLHKTFMAAVEPWKISASEVSKKPLELDLHPPLPHRVRLYMFNATHPPGGRTLGEHKVQLAVPGHKRNEQASFDFSDGRIVLLCGYEPEMEVFILWDSAFYPRFVFSRNIQVKPQTVFQALAGQIGQQLRRVRGQGIEVVLTAKARLLPDAIRMRMEISRKRMVTAARINDEINSWSQSYRQAVADGNDEALMKLSSEAPRLLKQVDGAAREAIPKPSLKRCAFIGSLAGVRVLLSAESGEVVVKIPPGVRPKQAASLAGLNLIPRKNALTQAAAAYEKAWHFANAQRKRGGSA